MYELYMKLFTAIQNDNIAEFKQSIRSFPDFAVDKRFPAFNNAPLLVEASSLNAEKIVKFLIEQRADPDAEDKNGHTPLKVASSEGHYNIVMLLLESGANVNKKSGEYGWTALVNACAKAHYKIAELLIEKGADVNVKFDDGTPLLFSLYKGHFDIARLLIKNGANVNAKDSDNVSPLNYAVSKHNNYEIAKLLIENGADVNHKTKDGISILQQAAFDGQLELAKLLLDNGANPDLRADNGGTPLGAASFRKNTDMVELLRRYGAKDDGMKNAPNEYPPDKKDLELLPIRARIAFAARCARYVQPLFKEFWPNADHRYYQSMETLLTAAEDAAKHAKKPEYESLTTSAAIVQHGMKLAEQVFQNEFKQKAITNSAWSALAAFFAVTVINENQEQITEFVAVAVSRSALAAMNSIPLLANNIEEIENIPSQFLGSKGKPIMETIWTDYYRILKASKENNWTDETVVAPNFFDS